MAIRLQAECDASPEEDTLTAVHLQPQIDLTLTASAIFQQRFPRQFVLRDGSDLPIKFFNEGTEDVSLRVFEAWQHGESGTIEIKISSSEGGAFAFRTGLYVVELYVDG